MVQSTQVQALLDRARREVDEGLLPSAQVALAKDGEVVAFETFGDATNATRYCFYSATKPIAAASVWALMGDGAIDITKKVVDYIPEFGTNGKEVITVEQVLLHTSGFPYAPLGPPAWLTREGRLEAFARWRLNWEPGTAFEYHATSAHWVLMEIVERITGRDYRDVIEERVTAPLGLPRLVGIPPERHAECAELILVGEPASPEELKAVLGIDAMPAGEVNDTTLVRFNEPETKELGVPGGGGWGTAADLAMFYQGLMRNPNNAFDPAILADVTSNIRNTFPDRMFGEPANRSIGLMLQGSGMGAPRFGHTTSQRAFGHGGAGGQIAWADPETGLSLGYTTNGLDRNQIRMGRRGTAISSLAGECGNATSAK